MKHLTKTMVIILTMVMSMCWTSGVMAETSTVSVSVPPGGALNADARLNFRINIPKFIIFTVGTAGSTVDEVVFDPAVADVAVGNPGTAATTNGTVTVSLISNGGMVAIAEANDGGGSGLSDGGINNISYSQIITDDTGSPIPAPTLSDAGGNSENVTPTINGITVETGQWTYTYDNPATPPAPGTYTGQVTYTASVP